MAVGPVGAARGHVLPSGRCRGATVVLGLVVVLLVGTLVALRPSGPAADLLPSPSASSPSTSSPSTSLPVTSAAATASPPEPGAEESVAALHRIAAAGGFLAYGLLVGTMALGLFAALGAAGPAVRRTTLVGSHRTLSTMSLSFAAVHAMANVVDPTATLRASDAFIPVLTWRSPAVAAGVLSAELGAAVALSVMARRRLSARAWRRLHRLGYVAFALAVVHVVAAGSDARRPLVATTVCASVAALGALLAVRVLRSRVVRVAPVVPGVPGRSIAPVVAPGRPTVRAESPALPRPWPTTPTHHPPLRDRGEGPSAQRLLDHVLGQP